MQKSLVYSVQLFYNCLHGSRCVVPSRRWMSMARRQNSLYPSSIYPRLDSVDLGEEDNPSKDVDPVKDIDFENYVDAFRNKSTWEILRALTVLKLCSINKLVDNSLELMRWVERRCGHRVLRIVCKPTFYNQFVGGETNNEIRTCVRKLAETRMRAMLAVTLEEDIGEEGDENVYDSNCQRILEAIAIVTEEDTPSPAIQLKLSGLLRADLLITLGKSYSSSPDKLKLIKAISKGLNENEIDATLFSDILDDKKLISLNKTVQRLKKICLEAKNQGVKVLVDAEYTYLNPGLSLITLAAVSVFNKDTPIVFNTYQCYLKDAQQILNEEMNMILNEMNVCFGAKVVRGAYMLKERSRAEKLQVQDPVCKDYESTNKNYNEVIEQLLVRTSELGSRCQTFVASHNEESVKLAIKKVFELNIDKLKGGVSFAQLYGMCDQVSNPLANSGYAVYKSVPYGTVDEVLPYLARRAVENRSVVEGARKEKMLLSKEFWRRTGRTVTCRSWASPECSRQNSL